MNALVGLFVLFIGFSSAQVLCIPCKSGVSVLYERLNSSNPIILEKAEEICKASPPIYYDLCLVTVNRTYHRIVSFVEQEIPPEEVCQKLGYCRDSQSVLPLTLPNYKPILCSLYNLKSIITSQNLFNQACQSLFTPLLCQQFIDWSESPSVRDDWGCVVNSFE